MNSDSSVHKPNMNCAKKVNESLVPSHSGDLKKSTIKELFVKGLLQCFSNTVM